MAAEDADPGSLSDTALRNEIRLLEMQIAVCVAQIEPKAAERKRSRRIARATFLTAAGFFGLTLEPLSGVIAVVGFLDWMEGLRDDAAAANLRVSLRRLEAARKRRLAILEAEVRRRGGRL